MQEHKHTQPSWSSASSGGAPVDLSELLLRVFVDDIRLVGLVVRDGQHAPRRRCAELQREADGLLARLVTHQQPARQLALSAACGEVRCQQRGMYALANLICICYAADLAHSTLDTVLRLESGCCAVG